MKKKIFFYWGIVLFFIGIELFRPTNTDAAAQGSYIKDGSYVTVTKSNYSIYSDFKWKKKASSKNYLNQTLQARGRYEHRNGSTYYSLYNNKGTWVGYLNKASAKKGTGKQGAYIKNNSYVTVNKSTYNTWSNFSWKSREKSKSYMYQTLYAAGRYHHFNGSTYYSLYANDGIWIGYLSSSSVKKATGPQGIYINDGHDVLISTPMNEYSKLYSDFNGRIGNNNIKKYLGKKLKVKGRYNHYDGTTYYSLYYNNKWIGYMNSDSLSFITPSKVKGTYSQRETYQVELPHSAVNGRGKKYLTFFRRSEILPYVLDNKLSLNYQTFDVTLLNTGEKRYMLVSE